MRVVKIGRRRSGVGMNRGTGSRRLGSILLAAAVVGSTGCDSDEDRLSEAMEEVRDEVEDVGEEIRDEAREAKEEIVDEVDDHT